MSPDERTLLSVAYKNVVASKRITWRTVVSVKENPKYMLYVESLNEYKKKLENAMYLECTNIIETVQKNILNKPCSDDAKAFFTKLVADNYRYIAEMSVSSRYRQAIADAQQNYVAANEIGLQACNPIKLSIALNLSVFHYEVQGDLAGATEIADQALQSALEKIDDLGEEEFKDAKAIIELLKENLSSWKEAEEELKRPIDEI